jgi:signal transduction histidine kinase
VAQIINLLSNAIKYTGASESPRIDIVLDASLEAPSWNLEHGSCKSLEHLEQDGYRRLFLSISVSDTGPGMESSALGRLFQRFTQIEPVFSIKAGGSGLVSARFILSTLPVL